MKNIIVTCFFVLMQLGILVHAQTNTTTDIYQKVRTDMLASVFLLSSKAKREPCLPLLKREKQLFRYR